MFASVIECGSGQFPLNYLRLLTGVSMRRCSSWQPIIDKFQARLSKWKDSLLLVGGRKTVCQSVLGALGLYYFSMFKAPTGIISKLESLRNRFFWGGNHRKKKISWVTWNKALAPKEKGSLGVSGFKALNMALLMKWWWRFKVDTQSLWRKVIVSIHGYKINQRVDPLKSKKPGLWGAIVSTEAEVNLYNLDITSLFQINGDYNQDNVNLEWSRPLDDSGKYTVSSLRFAIDDLTYYHRNGRSTTWLSSIPSKVNIFAWKLLHRSLATATNLTRQGIATENIVCKLCGEFEETDDHLFVTCDTAMRLLEDLPKRWSLDPLNVPTIDGTFKLGLHQWA